MSTRNNWSAQGLRLGLPLLAVALLAGPAWGQGKGGGKGGGGGNPSSITITFFDREGDRLRSVSGAPYSGKFNDAGNLILGEALLVLDLEGATPVGPDPCLDPAVACERDLILNQVLTHELNIRIDAIESMQPGESRLAQGQVSFGDPTDPDVLWRIKYEHFNSGVDVVPPGSFDPLQVTCTDGDANGCTRWVIGVTEPAARAALVSTRFTKKGKPTQERLFEGSFQIPFLMEVTRP